MEGSINAFRLESGNQDEKEKQEMHNKRVKMGGILIVCFLLLNFVLVVIVMNRTSESEISSSSPSAISDFSAAGNKTDETGQIVDQWKFELDGIKKWINSTEEKFESHQIQALSNQTKIDKEMDSLEKDNRQLQKSHQELKEQFESQSQKLDKIESRQIQIEALSNQTKIEEEMETLKNENQELQKSHEELKEQFESLSQKLDKLEVNISLEFKRAPAENEDHEPIEPIDPQSISSCSVAMEILPSPRSKKQTIYPYGNGTSLEVLCDFETDGGGWTLIQKRTSGPKQDFKRTWNEYSNGFGSLDGNFWLGLENIHALTENEDQELRIDFEDFEGVKSYAKYSRFSISNAEDFYRLTINGFYRNSTAGDAMTSIMYQKNGRLLFRHPNNGMQFSTFDKDNDYGSVEHCSLENGNGGWWFSNCGASGLNGNYLEKGHTAPDWTGIYWSIRETGYSKAKSEMKIRKRITEAKSA